MWRHSVGSIGGGVTLSGGGSLASILTVLSGGTLSADGSSAFVDASVENDGQVVVISGTLSITGAVSGFGVMKIDSNAILKLQDAVSNVQTVTFAGAAGQLDIGDFPGFGAPIASFQNGDTIDLENVAANTVSYDATSNLWDVGAQTADGPTTLLGILNLIGVPTDSELIAMPDGSGGTDITFAAFHNYANPVLEAKGSGTLIRPLTPPPPGPPISKTYILDLGTFVVSDNPQAKTTITLKNDVKPQADSLNVFGVIYTAPTPKEPEFAFSPNFLATDPPLKPLDEDPSWITRTVEFTPYSVGSFFALIDFDTFGFGTNGEPNPNYIGPETITTLQIVALVVDGTTPSLAVLDTTTGLPLPAVSTPYAGPVAGLQSEYINITSDSMNMSMSTPNWFIHSGSGDDAIAVSSGTNVLDGGTGSNFLTGGSGTDTFFVDDRAAPADIWSTVNNFHVGDAATIWGVTAQNFGLSWADDQGAAGFTGLTLHATAAGIPTASLTLAGYTQADLNNGRLSVLFGSDPASGSAYMYIHGNG
jgi:hypothetical protein